MPERNPYQSPRAKSECAETAPTRPPVWVRASGYLCILLCLLGVGAYSLTAAMLIPQALRLEAELQGMPVNVQAPGVQELQTELRDVVKISWVLGIVSIGLAATTLAAAILTFQQKYRYGWALLSCGIVVYVVLAIALKPN